ncbi:MAG TPA: PP2C family protein-serine/threonine phosphatase [Vicinamibacterales bacterium]|nr:PP2C family protein-serine/threonine phosphatase [Vicinamibacterales bacterium]
MSFAVGDVSGHGVSAALLMGVVHGAMSAPPWGASEDPDRAAVRLNELLLAKSSGQRFASLFWCAYDPASQVLQYLNAGHLPALRLWRETDGTWHDDRLSEGGPVLGVLPAAVYRTTSVQASEGDVLVLFSDGITEAPNRHEEPFGEDRLNAVAQQARELPARAICDAILAAVRAFTGGAPAPDDQTLLVVRLWRARGEATAH